MKIRNPITGKMEDTSKAKVLPSEEVKIMEPPKKPKKKKPLKKMGGGKVKGYKKGGSITYRMSGGQVTGNSYD